MVIWAQVGDSTHVGILVLGLGVVLLLHYVVDHGFVSLAIGINHRSSISAAGVTLALHVSFLFAITADNVGVVGTVVSGGDGRMSLGWVEVPGRKISLSLLQYSDLFDLVVGQFFPDDVLCLFQLQHSFDSCIFLRMFTIILNSLDFSGELHAFDKGSFAGFQDIVADGVLDAGQNS
jgi:hypothetical protein